MRVEPLWSHGLVFLAGVALVLTAKAAAPLVGRAWQAGEPGARRAAAAIGHGAAAARDWTAGAVASLALPVPGRLGAASGAAVDADVGLCRLDGEAATLARPILGRPDARRSEFFGFVYRRAGAALAVTPVGRGEGDRITFEAIDAAMAAAKVAPAQVVGFVHNHPAGIYAGSELEANVNRYPSGGAVPGGDWSFAERLIRLRGAQGDADLYFYVVDPRGRLRRFSVRDRAFYARLSAGDRDQGVGLPPTVDLAPAPRACR